MSAFIKKNFLIVLLTFLGCLFGIFYFFTQSPIYIFRAEYQYSAESKENLPSHLKKDTAFLFQNKIVVRNYKTSIADTLQKNGVFRGELKIQLTNKTDFKEKIKISNKILSTNQAYIVRVKSESIAKQFHYIYYACFTGFFLGIVIQYFSSSNKPIPTKEDNTIPN